MRSAFPLHSSQSITKLFLTGGSGFVGRNLIRHFTALGIAVVALVRSDKAREVVQALGAEAFMADLLSDDLALGMSGCQAMVHAAADTDHGLATDQQYRVNVDGTQRVFAAARRAGVSRAVHLSTESVLLDGRPLMQATETHPYPLKPVGAYSASKAAAEREALSSAGDGFAVMVLRPRFVWGRDDSTALPQLVQAVQSGQFAWIAGGRYLTSTTHIANLAHAVERALRVGNSGEIYFIADPDVVEFRSFITALLATQGLKAPEKQVPRWLVRGIAAVGEGAARLSGGRWVPPVTRQVLATSAVEVTLDIGKASQCLGYRPPISRVQGLAEMAEAYAARYTT